MIITSTFAFSCASRSSSFFIFVDVSWFLLLDRDRQTDLVLGKGSWRLVYLLFSNVCAFWHAFLRHTTTPPFLWNTPPAPPPPWTGERRRSGSGLNCYRLCIVPQPLPYPGSFLHVMGPCLTIQVEKACSCLFCSPTPPFPTIPHLFLPFSSPFLLYLCPSFSYLVS